MSPQVSAATLNQLTAAAASLQQQQQQQGAVTSHSEQSIMSAQMGSARSQHVMASAQALGVTRTPILSGIRPINASMLVSVDGRLNAPLLSDCTSPYSSHHFRFLFSTLSSFLASTTMASAHLQNAAAVMAGSQAANAHVGSQRIGNQSSDSASHHNSVTSSPRPGILRKRNNEG